MKPTTIYLPEETEIALQEIAKQNGKTLSEIIQEMVKEYSLTKKKLLPKCVGMGNSGMFDLSERVDELLWQDK
jgi:hypothetical protein